MTQKLDTIHHTALQVENIDKAVSWYTSRFSCHVAYQDDSWAQLDFANTSIALVLPKDHPYHVAVLTDDLSPYGHPTPHRDGTQSVYIKDQDRNTIEMLTLPKEDSHQL